MRGGTSRGPFFNANDLPSDPILRDKVLLAVMGSPDARQIDGLGGANPLTSKVGIVSPGSAAGIDLDFLFAQITPAKSLVDTTPNCGNMLAAVVPFALETGMLKAQGETSTYRVFTQNTGMVCEITVETPGKSLSYEGNTHIDGVPGTAAPITINFLDTAGSVCRGLLPTGNLKDSVWLDGIGEIEVTCIDNGMPLVILKACDLGKSGYETVTELNADPELKTRLESLRLACGHLMGLGDVQDKTYPKMTLIAPPKGEGSISTRSFIPHVCHDAIGVLAAVTVGTACVLKGSIAEGVANLPAGLVKTVSVEHPSGEFSVELAIDSQDSQRVTRAALIRTARLIMQGTVLIPQSIWDGQSGKAVATSTPKSGAQSDY